MAQRRFADGLLARLAKVARTGGALLPVLALVAVLAFAGCGGGDDSSDTGSTGAAASAGEGDQSGGAEAGQEASRQEASKGQGAQSGSGSSGSKQAPKAPQPQGEPEPGITPKQRSEATTASVTLESRGFKGGAVLPAKYTCDGGNESPPLRWSGVPDEAAELILFALNMNPVGEQLFFDWAVAGLDPSLEEIEEGKLPSGAIVGKNSFGKRGYSLCPPKEGESESYIFLLYAIPEALAPAPGFDPMPLRTQVLTQAGNVGLLSATYTRR